MSRADNYGTIRPDPRRRLFAPLPAKLLDDRSVSDRGVRLWGILDRIAAGREAAIGSRAGLAARLGCSPSSLDRARRELEAAGWLGVERIDGEASRYTLFDLPTYPQGVVIRDDTHLGVVTGEQTPSSRVTNPPSSPVTTEREVTTREDLETPPTPPLRRGADRCANGHRQPRRGCCTDRDIRAAATAAAAQAQREALAARRSVPWCGRCDGPDTRRVIETGPGFAKPAQPCPACNPEARTA